MLKKMMVLVVAWALTFFGLALSGYWVAINAPFAEAWRARDEGAPQMAPGEPWKSAEKAMWLVEVFWYPLLAVVIGAIVGIGRCRPRALMTGLAMAPFLLILLTSQRVTSASIAWALAFLGIAALVATMVERSRTVRDRSMNGAA